MTFNLQEYLPTFGYNYFLIRDFALSRGNLIASRKYIRFVLDQLEKDFYTYQKLQAKTDKEGYLEYEERIRLNPVFSSPAIPSSSIRSHEDLLVYEQIAGIVDLLDFHDEIRTQYELSPEEYELLSIETESYENLMLKSGGSILDNTTVWKKETVAKVRKIFINASRDHFCYADGIKIWVPEHTTRLGFKYFLARLEEEKVFTHGITMKGFARNWVVYGNAPLDLNKVSRADIADDAAKKINSYFY